MLVCMMHSFKLYMVLVKRIFQQSSNPTMCGIRSDSNIPQSIVPRNAIFRDRYRFDLETHPKVYSIQAQFASKLATIVLLDKLAIPGPLVGILNPQVST